MRRDSFAAGFAAGLILIAVMLMAEFLRRTPEVVVTTTSSSTSYTGSRGGTLPPPEPPLIENAVVIEREAAYVGNTNTHKLHLRTCRYAGCTNCTARFVTRDEATSAGDRPCGNCEP